MYKSVMLIISLGTLIVTLLTFYGNRVDRGMVEVTQPQTIFLQPANRFGPSEIIMTALIRSTADRGKAIEHFFVRLCREESIENFTVSRYEDKGGFRPGAFFVDRQGLSSSFHFSSPGYGAWYDFLPGDYTLQVYAKCAAEKELLVMEVHFSVTTELFRKMRSRKGRIEFVWSPDSRTYVGHVGARSILVD